MPQIWVQNIKYCIWNAVCKEESPGRINVVVLLFNTVYELALYGTGPFVICSFIYTAIY